MEPLKTADRDYSPFDHGTVVAGSYKPTDYGKGMTREEWNEYMDELMTVEEQELTNLF